MGVFFKSTGNVNREWGKFKDWDPKEFDEKEESWGKWKEQFEDYIDEIDRDNFKSLEYAAKQKRTNHTRGGR